MRKTEVLQKILEGVEVSWGHTKYWYGYSESMARFYRMPDCSFEKEYIDVNAYLNSVTEFDGFKIREVYTEADEKLEVIPHEKVKVFKDEHDGELTFCLEGGRYYKEMTEDEDQKPVAINFLIKPD